MQTVRQCFATAVVGLILLTGTAHAEDLGWVHEGMAEEGKFTGGFRVGPSFTTQDSGVSTVGPLVNFQGLYGLKSMVSCRYDAGMGAAWGRCWKWWS